MEEFAGKCKGYMLHRSKVRAEHLPNRACEMPVCIVKPKPCLRSPRGADTKSGLNI